MILSMKLVFQQIVDLIESNLRQRVLGNTNPVKLGRCFDFLNKYYGFQNGGDRRSEEKVFTLKNSNIPVNQSELADSYGITKQTMSNYMRMANMIPELEDLVDTGIVIVICVVYHIPIISCICVYLACKSVYEGRF